MSCEVVEEKTTCRDLLRETMPPFRVVLECRWIFSLGIFGSLLFCFGDDWIGVPVISKGSVGWVWVYGLETLLFWRNLLSLLVLWGCRKHKINCGQKSQVCCFANSEPVGIVRYYSSFPSSHLGFIPGTKYNHELYDTPKWTQGFLSLFIIIKKIFEKKQNININTRIKIHVKQKNKKLRDKRKGGMR